MEKSTSEEFMQQDVPVCKEGHINFFASMPCPMKNRFGDIFLEFLNEYEEKEYMPVYCPTVQLDAHKRIGAVIKDITEENELPDLFLSTGFGTNYSAPFRTRFMESGILKGYTPESQKPFIPEHLKSVMDKYGFGMLGLGSWQLVVDTRKLKDDTPRASSWDDLLKPEFKGLVTMHGHEGHTIISAVHHYYYEKFGMEGLVKFGENLKGVKHFSNIIKAIGAVDPQSTVYYILPAVIANQIPAKFSALPIQLKEGDIISPLLIYVKSDAMKKAEGLLEFFDMDSLSDLLKKSGYYPPESFNWDEPAYFPDWDNILQKDQMVFDKELTEAFEAKLEVFDYETI